MNELSFNDPCLLFALRHESEGFRREFRPNQRFAGADCTAYFCAPRDLPELSVLVLETGMGTEHARSALQWVLSRPLLENVPYRPKLVLSAGFCGALHPERQVGDVILATEVTDEAGNLRRTTWPGELPPGDWQPPLHPGRMLTTAQLLGSAAEKQALGRQHEAVAVDMESAALAALCHRAEVPFGCVRAVSDDVHTSISPQSLSLVTGSQGSLLRVLRAVALRPRLVPELLRLRRAAQQASEQLGKALGELLTLTLTWTAP